MKFSKSSPLLPKLRAIALMIALAAALLVVASCTEEPAPASVAKKPGDNVKPRPDIVPAKEPVTRDVVARRVRGYIAMESFVRRMREGNPEIYKADGTPWVFSNMSQGYRLKFESHVREFGRALVVGPQVENRTTLAAFINGETLRDNYVYTFDSATGDATVTFTLHDRSASVTINAYRLAAAANAGGEYHGTHFGPLAP